MTLAHLGEYGETTGYKGLSDRRELEPGTLVQVIGYVPDDEGGEVLVDDGSGYVGRCHALDLEDIWQC